MPTGSFALYAENKILELIVGKTAFNLSAAYVALFTIAPTNEDGTGGMECSAGNYARKATSGSDWAAAVDGAITNAESIIFLECADENWGEINGWALFDAASGGNMRVWGNLTTPLTITIGETAKFNAGELDITQD